MELKIFLNKTYKHSCNMIDIIVKCEYFNITQYKNEKTLLINNIIVNSEFINSIEFILNGYKNNIDINNNMPIISTNMEYKEALKAKDVFTLNKIIKEI